MKSYLITAGIALGVVVVWGTLFAPVQKVINQTTQLGAVSSPDMASPYFSFGGVRRWATSAGFTPASQTLCAMHAPAATSTIISASVRFDTTIATGASSYELGWGATSGATTTVLARTLMASGRQTKELVATTSISGTPVLTDNVVAPSTWINFNIASGTPSASFAPTGRCEAVFQEI